jgi:hypothetical protein
MRRKQRSYNARPTMSKKNLTPASAVLVTALALGMVLGPQPVAQARDLVKVTAALVLAEDPPPTRTQLLEEQKKKEAAAQAVETKKEVDQTPYYKKWWFWALTGVVVGGTVALGVWAVDTTTAPAKSCSPGVTACFGDGRRQ